MVKKNKTPKYTCEECGSTFEPSRPIHDRDVYIDRCCGECVEKLCEEPRKCAICGECKEKSTLYSHDIAKYKGSSQDMYVCNDCFEHKISLCTECNDTYHVDEMDNYCHNGNDDLYCLNCIDVFSVEDEEDFDDEEADEEED